MNNYDRWVAGFKYIHENDLNLLPTKTKQNKNEPWNTSKFTDSEGGNDKFGGGSKNSKGTYSTLVTDIKTKRLANKEKVARLEGIMLKAIQNKEGIHPKNRRGKKKSKKATQNGTNAEENWDNTPLVFVDDRI